jgi:hypothetical protein
MTRKEQHDQLSAMAGLSPEGAVLPPNTTQADEAKDVISRDLYDELYAIKEGYKNLSDEALALVDKTRTQLADAQREIAQRSIMQDTLLTQLADVQAQLAEALRCLSPIQWGEEEKTAWHTSVPDIVMAFGKLKEIATLQPTQDKE